MHVCMYMLIYIHVYLERKRTKRCAPFRSGLFHLNGQEIMRNARDDGI